MHGDENFHVQFLWTFSENGQCGHLSLQILVSAEYVQARTFRCWTSSQGFKVKTSNERQYSGACASLPPLAPAFFYLSRDLRAAEQNPLKFVVFVGGNIKFVSDVCPNRPLCAEAVSIVQCGTVCAYAGIRNILSHSTHVH